MGLTIGERKFIIWNYQLTKSFDAVKARYVQEYGKPAPIVSTIRSLLYKYNLTGDVYNWKLERKPKVSAAEQILVAQMRPILARVSTPSSQTLATDQNRTALTNATNCAPNSSVSTNILGKLLTTDGNQSHNNLKKTRDELYSPASSSAPFDSPSAVTDCVTELTVLPASTIPAHSFPTPPTPETTPPAGQNSIVGQPFDLMSRRGPSAADSLREAKLIHNMIMPIGSYTGGHTNGRLYSVGTDGSGGGRGPLAEVRRVGKYIDQLIIEPVSPVTEIVIEDEIDERDHNNNNNNNNHSMNYSESRKKSAAIITPIRVTSGTANESLPQPMSAYTAFTKQYDSFRRSFDAGGQHKARALPKPPNEPMMPTKQPPLPPPPLSSHRPSAPPPYHQPSQPPTTSSHPHHQQAYQHQFAAFNTNNNNNHKSNNNNNTSNGGAVRPDSMPKGSSQFNLLDADRLEMVSARLMAPPMPSGPQYQYQISSRSQPQSGIREPIIIYSPEAYQKYHNSNTSHTDNGHHEHHHQQHHQQHRHPQQHRPPPPPYQTKPNMSTLGPPPLTYSGGPLKAGQAIITPTSAATLQYFHDQQRLLQSQLNHANRNQLAGQSGGLSGGQSAAKSSQSPFKTLPPPPQMLPHLPPPPVSQYNYQGAYYNFTAYPNYLQIHSNAMQSMPIRPSTTATVIVSTPQAINAQTVIRDPRQHSAYNAYPNTTVTYSGQESAKLAAAVNQRTADNHYNNNNNNNTTRQSSTSSSVSISNRVPPLIVSTATVTATQTAVSKPTQSSPSNSAIRFAPPIMTTAVASSQPSIPTQNWSGNSNCITLPPVNGQRHDSTHRRQSTGQQQTAPQPQLKPIGQLVSALPYPFPQHTRPIAPNSSGQTPVVSPKSIAPKPIPPPPPSKTSVSYSGHSSRTQTVASLLKQREHERQQQIIDKQFDDHHRRRSQQQQIQPLPQQLPPPQQQRPNQPTRAQPQTAPYKTVSQQLREKNSEKFIKLGVPKPRPPPLKQTQTQSLIAPSIPVMAMIADPRVAKKDLQIPLSAYRMVKPVTNSHSRSAAKLTSRPAKQQSSIEAIASKLPLSSPPVGRQKPITSQTESLGLLKTATLTTASPTLTTTITRAITITSKRKISPAPPVMNTFHSGRTFSGHNFGENLVTTRPPPPFIPEQRQSVRPYNAVKQVEPIRFVAAAPTSLANSAEISDNGRPPRLSQQRRPSTENTILSVDKSQAKQVSDTSATIVPQCGPPSAEPTATVRPNANAVDSVLLPVSPFSEFSDMSPLPLVISEELDSSQPLPSRSPSPTPPPKREHLPISQTRADFSSSVPNAIKLLTFADIVIRNERNHLAKLATAEAQNDLSRTRAAELSSVQLPKANIALSMPVIVTSEPSRPVSVESDRSTAPLDLCEEKIINTSVMPAVSVSDSSPLANENVDENGGSSTEKPLSPVSESNNPMIEINNRDIETVALINHSPVPDTPDIESVTCAPIESPVPMSATDESHETANQKCALDEDVIKDNNRIITLTENTPNNEIISSPIEEQFQPSKSSVTAVDGQEIERKTTTITPVEETEEAEVTPTPIPPPPTLTANVQLDIYDCVDKSDFVRCLNLIKERDLRRKPLAYLNAKYPLNEISRAIYAGVATKKAVVDITKYPAAREPGFSRKRNGETGAERDAKKQCLYLETLGYGRPNAATTAGATAEKVIPNPPKWSFYLKNIDLCSPLATRIIGVVPRFQFHSQRSATNSEFCGSAELEKRGKHTERESRR